LSKKTFQLYATAEPSADTAMGTRIAFICPRLHEIKEAVSNDRDSLFYLFISLFMLKRIFLHGSHVPV
jgi:hypothetical protein